MIRKPNYRQHPIYCEILEVCKGRRIDLEKCFPFGGIKWKTFNSTAVFDHVLIKNREGDEEYWTPCPLTELHFLYIYGALKIKPERLLLTKVYDKAFSGSSLAKTKTKRWFTIRRWAQMRQRWPPKLIWPTFAGIPDYHKGGREKLLGVYKELSKYYQEATRCIDAHEVLLKGNLENPGEEGDYQEAQEKIHRAILAALATNEAKGNKKFQYSRTFFLSSSERLFPKRSLSQRLRAFMAEAPLQTLQHILVCSRDYSGVNFQLVANHSSFRQYVNIDNKHLLVEDYALNNNAVVPERVVRHGIGHKTDAENMLTFVKDTAQRYRSESIPTNNYNAFRRILTGARGHAKKGADIREKAMDLLEEDFDLTDLRDRIEKTELMYRTQIAQLDHKIAELDREMKYTPRTKGETR